MTNRRDFLRIAVGTAAGALLGSKSGLLPSITSQAAAGAADKKSLIVRVKAKDVWKGNMHPEKDVVERMVLAGMREFTGKKDEAGAWGSLFKPDDVVGIKISAVGGKMLSSNRELVDAMISGLLACGVKENNIIVWERFVTQLKDAGFTINKSGKGIRGVGTEVFMGRGGRGYDKNVYLEYNKEKSNLTKIISQDITALINVPVLKDHGETGITNALKNIAFGAINNTERFHRNKCDPQIADVCAMPEVKNKFRLCIVDALRCVYEGGPADRPANKWEQNEIMIGTDQVALDVIGWEIIEKKRAEKGLPSLKKAGREPVHISTAEKKGLGTVKKEKMDIRVLSV
ncbi:MAG: DUF362 domain-containing protein [bacterium]